MRRRPSIKQQFIKEYAKVLDGPQATSDALKGAHRANHRAAIKNVFDFYAHNELLIYAIWLQKNWKQVLENHKHGNFKADLTRPGTFLLSLHFVDLYLPWALRGENLQS